MQSAAGPGGVGLGSMQLGCSCTGPPNLPLHAPPTRRHQLSLYAHISKITWHFDQRDRVAGTLSSAATRDVHKFELDPQELGEFEVVNRLWDMMDGN